MEGVIFISVRRQGVGMASQRTDRPRPLRGVQANCSATVTQQVEPIVTLQTVAGNPNLPLGQGTLLR